MKTWMTFAVSFCLLTACQTKVQRTEKDFVGNWLEVMPVNSQFIQGVTLNADGTASSIGMATLKYESWSLSENDLILNGKSIGNGQTIDFSDTLEVVNLSTDSMKLGKGGMYRIDYFRVEERPEEAKKPVNPIDSLAKPDGTGELQTRVFRGTLPAADCPGIVYNITLYNYEHSGDGVFKARLTYLEAENGKDTSFEFCGHQYTLKGNAVDNDATVLQFIPFADEKHQDIMNFQLKGNDLEMLDRDMKPIESKLNYTLKLQ